MTFGGIFGHEQSMKKNKLRVLVIAPHHDDEVIGCGGTICLLVDKGCEVGVVHIFSGTSGVTGLGEKESSMLRVKEAKKAGLSGGYRILGNLNFVDRKDLSIEKITYGLIKEVRDYEPDIVFAPHSDEQDIEHKTVSKAAWEALWLSATDIFSELGNSYNGAKIILGYEIWRPMESVGLYVDITKYAKLKARLIKKFATQVKKANWMSGSLGLNAYRGTTLQGNGYAEAFNVRNCNLENLAMLGGRLF